MATPFVHTEVKHISRMGRRRSQSVTLPKSGREETARRSVRRKQILASLKNERQKQLDNYDGQYENTDVQQQNEEEHPQPVVTKISRIDTTTTMKKQTSSTRVISTSIRRTRSSSSNKSTYSQENEKQHDHQPQVTRLPRSESKMSFRKQTANTTNKSIHTHEAENQHAHQPQVTRIPRSESQMSLRKQLSTSASKNANINLINTTKNAYFDSSVTYNGVHLNSSGTSSIPFQTSSTNLISKSELFDQEFNLNDSKNHGRKNDTKDHGTVKINERKKNYSVSGRKLPVSSSASFMAAIIAIIIAVIAFAFGLAALILVLLLRSTVNASLGTNSTSGSSSGDGTLPSACSSYTTLDDPTRHISAPGYALGCDNSAPFINRTYPVWIRFIGTGGTTLPLQPPGVNICGSEGAGWYDGTMPTSSGQIINGTACFTWYTSVCRFSSSISVAHCGSFYIYYLPPPPACMMRYCTI